MSADGHHSSKEIVVDGVSSLDEPSVEWGWHGHSRKVGVVVGGFFVLFLLAMLFGNHIGRVEDIWLVSVAAFLAIWMILALRPKKDDTLAKSKIYEVSSDHYAVVGTAASGRVGAEAARNPEGRAPAKH